jgi:subtilisin family serine protease
MPWHVSAGKGSPLDSIDVLANYAMIRLILKNKDDYMTKIILKSTVKTTLSVFLISAFISSCNTTESSFFIPEQPVVNIHPEKSEFDINGISKTTVLVKLKDKVNANSVESFIRKYNTNLKRTIEQINVLVLKVPDGYTLQKFLKELRADLIVSYAEPNIRIDLDEDEISYNDPLFPEQYSLKKVEAGKAWFLNTGKDTVKIAIIDSGVDLEHPDLKAKLLEGYNALDPAKPPKDDVRHGTHVAGIAGAIGNNGVGVAGLASNCKIIPVKVLGANSGTLDSISAGLIWAADNGADVVNMSLGTYSENQTLAEAVKYALGKNVVCIATMGNDNTEKKRYPAAYPGMIAVGSTDENDKKSGFSNYGSWMTVSAPGSNILSTLPTYMSSGNIGYGKLSGTSMAAPLVTGLAGLIRSQHKDMHPKDVSKMLQDSADDLGEIGHDKYFGAGRINAFKAVKLARSEK